jgi:hypothetical protein
MKLCINSIFKQQQGQREEREEKDLDGDKVVGARAILS